MDGSSWVTAVGNPLLAGGVFEGATLTVLFGKDLDLVIQKLPIIACTHYAGVI